LKRLLWSAVLALAVNGLASANGVAAAEDCEGEGASGSESSPTADEDSAASDGNQDLRAASPLSVEDGRTVDEAGKL